MIIEPLKVKQPSRTVREIKALVVGLQVAIVTELSAAKEEILHRLGDVETSIETLARETARNLAHARRAIDGDQADTHGPTDSSA